MRREDQVLAVEKLLEYDAAKTTEMSEEAASIDASRYVDPGLLERERESLFMHYPQVVGMSVDLEAGHYSTQSVAGVPVVLTRDNQGEFHAFLNACRHRGTTVAEGCGKARRLTCPWHAWSYDLRGALVGVAHQPTFGEIDKTVNGLVELPSAERHGLLFLQLTPGETIDLDSALGDLGPELESFNLESLHPVRTRGADIDVNWKLANDTGFELYHVQYLHKNSVGGANIGNTGLYRQYGYNHRMTALSPAARDIDRSTDHWDPMDHLQFIYNIFPSTGLVVAKAMVALQRLDPGPTPGQSALRFTSYSWTPIDNDDARAGAEMIGEFLFNVVCNEDMPTAAHTQKNLETGLLKQLLVGRNELAIANAHASYDAVLAGADWSSPR
ncbi:aromatic ring-hydroxylating dioxygenase subunit alpha [Mycolicibacterium fluoranthenivorans]|uniref:Aromatic ring-hydroxylating dioxygenase subunit alpha n=1 Tax=Mycolicibacterium fluoranthenivorans TaxID=258505 RepID=A0A7G8P6X4_9MYCO|nr:aromatic ring-hydroxylating dioxygenase subunit alpha [Mycolicibacterium fluoranthenivorans]QNJ90090.1 aromatic ring-hydroxylating dioxygenase subunit alpha [Mycolicibacterium fluoranthenivorans]